MLRPEEAKSFYDRLGKLQDTQKFYERAALHDLVAHGAFEQASAVFEFGCGTGSFANQLLSDYLPSQATYLGVDISSTMVRLARGKPSSLFKWCMTDKTSCWKLGKWIYLW